MENNLEQRVANLEKLLHHTHDGVNSHVVDYNNLFNIASGGNFYVGSGSRDNSDGTGDEAVTGVGFTPKAVLVVAASSANANCGMSIGFSDGSTDGCVRNYYSSGWLHIVLANIIAVYDEGGDQTTATVSSLDTDGFTMNFSSMDEDISYRYLCFG